MRELKFRAAVNGKIRYDVTGFEHGKANEMAVVFLDGEPHTIGPECIIEQFTGLTDKNGTEIYEGDLLRVPAKNKWEETNYKEHEVFFHDNDAADNHVGFQMNRVKFRGALAGGYIHEKFLPKYTKQMIVTDNIHEQTTSHEQGTSAN